MRCLSACVFCKWNSHTPQLKTAQVCSWTRNEGRTQRWEGSDAWLLRKGSQKTVRPYNKLYTHLVFKPSIIISCDSPAVSLHNVFVYVCVSKDAIMGKCGHRDTVPRNPAKTVLSIRLVCSVTLGYLRIELLYRFYSKWYHHSYKVWQLKLKTMYEMHRLSDIYFLTFPTNPKSQWVYI